ncbi:hypothetical protein GH741_15680 [Aquibacillus halophilus]|uniref:LRAT domain-containing protein n=1 Tax=Aquibacillus halophilus TaxID=930132 RepID=A0A6A8DEL3_9BACI|nr:hypothetical protein [Aquibacillus halophilus]MRH44083.1 hypothetical protein [Aquibacillus halophilus]
MSHSTTNSIKTYPQTNELITPGDILYSSKGWSTFLVGHVGIVGPDLSIHHSHPSGGYSDSLPGYLSRHKFGGDIIVFRPKIGASQAAEWAVKNIGAVNKYIFHLHLDNIALNYCSKFIWQAFWFSQSVDITSRNLSHRSKNWVYPMNIKSSWNLEVVTTINL